MAKTSFKSFRDEFKHFTLMRVLSILRKISFLRGNKAIRKLQPNLHKFLLIAYSFGMISINLPHSTSLLIGMKTN